MYHQGKIGREGRSCEADVRVVNVSLAGWCSVKPESTVSGRVVLHFKMPLFFIWVAECHCENCTCSLTVQRGCLAAYVSALFVGVCVFSMFINVCGGLSVSLCSRECDAAFCHVDLLSGGRVRDGRLPGTEAVVPLCHLCPACFTLLPVIPWHPKCPCPFPPCSLPSVRCKEGWAIATKSFLWWSQGPALVVHARMLQTSGWQLSLMISSSGTCELWVDVVGNKICFKHQPRSKFSWMRVSEKWDQRLKWDISQIDSVDVVII